MTKISRQCWNFWTTGTPDSTSQQCCEATDVRMAILSLPEVSVLNSLSTLQLLATARTSGLYKTAPNIPKGSLTDMQPILD